MSEPQAQRTLVKSPPELWAEVSDAGTLARHLGEFGDIRITRLEAETTVVWEGDRARGTVELEASGWGTKVTITAAAVVVEEEPEAVAATTAEPEAVEERTESVAPPGFEEAPAVTAPAPRRRGFWARLFRRNERAEAEPVAAEPEPIAEVEVEVEEPAAIAPPEPEDAEIVVTAMGDDEVEAVLVAVLDDLGSAHHRPFSRG